MRPAPDPAFARGMQGPAAGHALGYAYRHGIEAGTAQYRLWLQEQLAARIGRLMKDDHEGLAALWRPDLAASRLFTTIPSVNLEKRRRNEESWC